MCNNDKCTCCQEDAFAIQKPGKTMNGITTSTGDSRAIRIGNDIKLDVTIQELNGMDIINIKAIKCIIVNTTPMLSDHCGTAYEIHRCGLPTYHIHPMHEYWGYGMHPFGPKNWHHGLYPHFDYFCRNPYGRHYLKPIPTAIKPNEFIAPVKALAERNKVRVFFPASAQLLCGLYSLTFVIELYEPGYHCNNLRTITVDYNNVFELVPNMEGAAGDITIDIDKQLGVNVYDETMFGKVNQPGYTEEPAYITDLTINGAETIQVGKSAWYNCTTGDEPTSKIEWTGYGAYAQLPAESGNRVLVSGVKVNDVIHGADTFTLEVKATDGGNATATKEITIHNYTTAIGLNGGIGDSIDLGDNQEMELSIYVMQEDGTKLCRCEQGGNCQAIPAGTAEILSGGEYFDITPIISNSDNCGGACEEIGFKIKNTNYTSVSQSGTIVLKSNTFDHNGNIITKTITINCNPSTRFEPDEDGIVHTDRYVTNGRFADGTLVLNRNGEADLEIPGFPTQVEPNYWYTEETL